MKKEPGGSQPPSISNGRWVPTMQRQRLLSSLSTMPRKPACWQPIPPMPTLENAPAFLIGSKTIHGFTTDRTEFLGRGGTPASPIALHRLGLESRLTPGEDPCAVLQLHIDLLPGAVDEIYFVLGQGRNKEHALELAKKYHDPAYVGTAPEENRDLLG